ncbi:peptide ABC transporter substrate-binding protein [Thalassobacillus devorans]|uniref:Peptide ABC transporter substrate-binding protein n=1 Tax=Thalassobacillus devorans TaxID=279813 RepID=A0ABQ1NM87_9BACI|nr:peptide ABC transporter substrate-binding protein [Thalassobacillus devorans]NIK27066.1 oligopeptide transport system substrate-binding protein [Thalassobacillus devorans]GGC74640.1 peptide ABC transporter substrate-binding protein [Thalassobacillus devorans]
MRKTNWLLLALALVLSMFLVACSGGNDDNAGGNDSGEDTSSEEGGSEEAEGGEPSGEQVLNLIEGSQIPTMDSSHATDAVAFQWLGETMEGLYRLNEEAQPEPAIAEGEPEVSEDGLEWTIKLREDAVWSNGDPVTANDFVFAWQRAIDPETGSEYGPFMMNDVLKNATAINNGEADVEELGVEATGDYELKITLEKEVPYFHSLLTFGTYLPLNEDFVTEQGDDYALTSDNLLYNGPFILEDWDPKANESWKLTKNEDYWDAENVTLETINVNVVKETSTGVNLYENGEIDRAGLSSEFVEKYAGSEDYRTMPEPVLFYLKMNQENEALANADIRKAIAMSIDKQSLVDVILANGSIPSNAAVPEDFVTHPESGEDFRELNGDLITSDKEKAKEHWEKGLEALGTDSVTLRFLGGDSEVAKEMDDYLINQLEENLEGLSLELSSVPFEERIARDEKSDYDIQNSGWGPDYLDASTWLNMWMSDSPYMTMNYNSEKYDSLMQEANNDLLTDLPARFDKMLEAEKVLIEEDTAIAPLYQRSRAYLWRPSVKGVQFNPMGADFTYKHAYIEE